MAEKEIKEEGVFGKDFSLLKEPFRKKKRKAPLYLLLLMLILVLIFLWIFKGRQEEADSIGSLTIRSNPSQATIYLDRERKCLTPCKIIDVPFGGYIVEVVKDGFIRETRGIKIAKGQSQLALSIELKEAAEGLEESYGVKKEETLAGLPKEEKLPPVPVKEKEANIKDIQKKEGASSLKNLTEQKKIGTGILFVTSSPAGATVYIDHYEKGVTPLKIERVDVGKRRVGLIKEGYSTWTDYFEVEKDRQVSVKASLKPIYGKIIVSSNPAGATLYLNGKKEGKTPIVLDKIAPLKAQRITLILENYQDWEIETFVDPKGETKIEANLLPGESLRSSLYITSTPSLVEIYLDRDFIGLTPIRGIPILPGEHLVEAKKEGFISASKEITALAKRSSFVNFTLEEKK